MTVFVASDPVRHSRRYVQNVRAAQPVDGECVPPGGSDGAELERLAFFPAVGALERFYTFRLCLPKVSSLSINQSTCPASCTAVQRDNSPIHVGACNVDLTTSVWLATSHRRQRLTTTAQGESGLTLIVRALRVFIEGKGLGFEDDDIETG